MGAYGNMDAAIAGLQHGLDPRIESGEAQETINFGSPVFGYQNVPGKVWGAHRDKATVSLDADLVTANVYTVTINGKAIAYTFSGTHAASMTALIAAINADTDMIAAGITAVAGTTNRDIVIKRLGGDLTVTGAVTLGASQANVSVVYGNWGKFLGVAAFHQTSHGALNAGSEAYVQYDSVNILAEGLIWVPVSVAVEDKQAAYVITEVTNQGKFTNSSTLTMDVGGYFRSGRQNNLAVLEVRGLK